MKKYFFGDFDSVDFWQKFREEIKLPLKTFSKINLFLGVDLKL